MEENIITQIKDIREWVTFGANICILLITLYTFYLTFISNKIKILSFRKRFSYEGNSMSIVIENKSLSPISITEICAIAEKKYKFNFKKFDEPLVLAPFSTKVISMNPFSYMPKMDLRNIVFQIETSNKTRYISFKKRFIWITKDVKKSYPNITISTNKFNDKIIMPGTKYILTLIIDGKIKTIFIYKNGVMTSDVFGYNALPSDIVNNKDQVKQVIDKLVKPYDIKFDLIEENYKL